MKAITRSASRLLRSCVAAQPPAAGLPLAQLLLT